MSEFIIFWSIYGNFQFSIYTSYRCAASRPYIDRYMLTYSGQNIIFEKISYIGQYSTFIYRSIYHIQYWPIYAYIFRWTNVSSDFPRHVRVRGLFFLCPPNSGLTQMGFRAMDTRWWHRKIILSRVRRTPRGLLKSRNGRGTLSELYFRTKTL